jgi:drug/metabolite transporter (DMT)-like permease
MRYRPAGEMPASSSDPFWKGGLLALLSALAFGVTTPLVQRSGKDLGPFSTAALLYAGAALASVGWRSRKETPVRRQHLPRLLAVAIAGAALGPAALAWGLQHTGGASASLLLNFEAVFTVLLARLFYREPIGRRAGIALAIMTAGGGLVVLGGQAPGQAAGWGTAAVAAATLCWSVDNTLTRPLADLDPARVVRWKAALGAALSLSAGLALKEALPAPRAALGLLACGATGYGLSLRLYLLAQRRIGAGRTGSIFAAAPFVGAVVAWALGDRTATGWTAAAAGLFALGVVLHLTEKHAHAHSHAPLEHEHAHSHDDAHHDHRHDPPVTGEHSHVHRHEAATHTHSHAPDLHHRHEHD